MTDNRQRRASIGPAPARVAGPPILGTHPTPPNPLGQVLAATDSVTVTKVPHRALTPAKRAAAASRKALRAMLVRHHASPEALQRSRAHADAMKAAGFAAQQASLQRFPTNDSTRKGNLAEVVLAEYVVAANTLTLPVYRLRYNPNVDQSMKGDDVLAFDLDAKPVRIVVGEAKFRGVSTNAAVKEIVEGLVRSHKAGIPVSLQFVAERLFEANQTELGTKVLNCATLFARGELHIDYVGMLLSDAQAATRVDTATPASLHRLAMISLGLADPDALVTDCYEKLE
ncbi:MAG: DUF1837 domain-containing protein [Deltaproteobacteria bacterium]|nr:DUF1837 domain-containing protein [Deltaproteobacteria bacterium]